MNPWLRLFRRPSAFSDDSATHWFIEIANKLLNHTLWMIAGTPHRLTEIEFYYRGPSHEDPFAHANPIQAEAGRWYFHMVGASFRSGTFKGLDISFGDGQSRAGILIRGIEKPDGQLIDGPSLVVDRALALCRKKTVKALDEAIGPRPMWDKSSPLHLVDNPDLGRIILATSRVGLSLRRMETGSAKPVFLTRPYRYLTAPAAIRKGRAQTAMALHRSGCAADEIQQIMKCPRRVVATFLREHRLGVTNGTPTDFFGKQLNSRGLCRLHGIADRI